MHIIVGGCGRLGAAIAEELSRDPDNDVVVLDTDPRAFDRLGSAFNGETIKGDVTDRDDLERAGVSGAHGLLAVTRFDNANLMAVEIAKHLYDVDRAVARLFNPARESSYQKLGIDYVSGTSVLAKLFMNSLRKNTFRHHLTFDFGDIAIVEMIVGAAAHGMVLGDFELDGKLRVAAIQRGPRVLIPRADERIEHGDLVVAATRRGTFSKMRGLVQSATVKQKG